MQEEVSDYFHVYFCRATSGWARAITSDMYSSLVTVISGARFPPEVVKVVKPLFVTTGIHDTDSVAEYVEDPSKCTPNPYVYHAMTNEMKNMDLPWIDKIIKGRTPNYEEVHAKLAQGAEELSHAQKCYKADDFFDLIDNIVTDYQI